MVLDASAALALLLGERGADRVALAGADAVVGAVNLTEVMQQLERLGVSPAVLDAADQLFEGCVEPFTEHLARDAARLFVGTRPLGLSLGDRACLALARALKAPVMTADRAWAALDVGVAIEVIR